MHADQKKGTSRSSHFSDPRASASIRGFYLSKNECCSCVDWSGVSVFLFIQRRIQICQCGV